MISVEKCAQKLKTHPSDTCLLDVREASEFEGSHIPGSVNVPMSELALHVEELARFKRVYVLCQSGRRRSELAARTLDYLGFQDIVRVKGGFQAWTGMGLPVAPQ
jgi:rhodanese-related sulfurtransferase